MTRTIRWLHLSDLHARKRTDWNAREVIETLAADLKKMSSEVNFRPDLIFFTGDLAFGSVSHDLMSDQYQAVRKVINSVRRAYSPEVPERDVYLVPGNHDVDRGEITPEQTEWLRSPKRQLAEILSAMESQTKQWRAWMERFSPYRTFLRGSGLAHLSPEDPHLIWADARELAGIRVGIIGLNSAWSAADDGDKAKLWCGFEWQIATLRQRMGPVDLAFALIHPPRKLVYFIRRPLWLSSLAPACSDHSPRS